MEIIEKIAKEIADQKSQIDQLKHLKKHKIINSDISEYLKIKNVHVYNLKGILISENENYEKDLDQSVFWWNVITEKECTSIIHENNFSGLVGIDAIYYLWIKEGKPKNNQKEL